MRGPLAGAIGPFSMSGSDISLFISRTWELSGAKSPSHLSANSKASRLPSASNACRHRVAHRGVDRLLELGLYSCSIYCIIRVHNMGKEELVGAGLRARPVGLPPTSG